MSTLLEVIGAAILLCIMISLMASDSTIAHIIFFVILIILFVFTSISATIKGKLDKKVEENKYDSISESCYKSYDLLPLSDINNDGTTQSESDIIYIKETNDNNKEAYKIYVKTDTGNKILIIYKENTSIIYIESGDTPRIEYWKRVKHFSTKHDTKDVEYSYCIIYIPQS